MIFVACLGKMPLLALFFLLSVPSVGESSAGKGTVDGTIISAGEPT